MNSTSTLFNQTNSTKVLNENNLERFFMNFPEMEFWRFFVERSRYDYRQDLLRSLYSAVVGVSSDEVANISLMEIEDEIKNRNMTVGDIYELAKDNNDILDRLNNDWHLDNRKEEKFFDIIDQHQAWVGFDENEPRYLLHMAKGFQLIVSNIVNQEPFDIALIKNLHKSCTENVKNMPKELKPGEFRTYTVSWHAYKDHDSCNGLAETIDYFKTVEKTYGMSCFTLEYSEKSKPNVTPWRIDNFSRWTTKPEVMANGLWKSLESGDGYINFYAKKNGMNTNDFLEKINNDHINTLENSLKNAETKHQKITAIFTYLKHIVLHHSFEDGVGRTYSMLLSQYLLMRENLLPVFIKNSNMIPGFSVEEMVQEYLRAEKEMEKILKNNTYVNSEKISDTNINTLALLEKISRVKLENFYESLDFFKEAKELYLSAVNRKTCTV